MLGTLGRYLRFMGYNTVSANNLTPGNSREDTLLLGIASRQGRILLTRDRELARRGGPASVFITPVPVLEQLQELVDLGLIEPRLRLTRCSLCNQLLRSARRNEIQNANYAPEDHRGYHFLWCQNCRKLYWTGSHAKDLCERLKKGITRSRISAGRLRRL
jgi:uncharacterized protein